MATTSELHELVGKMMTDPGFRAEMAHDPGKAAKGAGVTLTAEQEGSFKKNTHAFVTAGSELDKAVASPGAASAGGHFVGIFKQ